MIYVNLVWFLAAFIGGICSIIWDSVPGAILSAIIIYATVDRKIIR